MTGAVLVLTMNERTNQPAPVWNGDTTRTASSGKGKRRVDESPDFDPNDMTPDDCVHLADLMSNILINEFSRAAFEDGSFEIDRFQVMRMMTDLAGMPMEEITKFCEIGEYIMLDRETRGMSEEEIDRWNHRREAALAVIEAMITQAVNSGLVDRESADLDPTVEMLEEIWRLS